MKGPVVEYLRSQGHEVTDYGTDSEEPVDFPDIAQRVTTAILSGDAERGILVCGTGGRCSHCREQGPGHPCRAGARHALCAPGCRTR